MPVKFIVVEDEPGEFRIIFGKGYYDEYHENIRLDNNIPENAVRGGGWADQQGKRIWGDSLKFGRYSRKIVEELLPGWTFGL